MVVGDYEVDALLDAEGSFATYAEAFPDAGEDDWAPWRDRHPELFDGDRWRLPFRSYLIRGGGRTILVDTGVGPSRGGEFLPERQGWLPGELERLGASPDTVFLTHVHVDHVGWNHLLRRRAARRRTGKASRCRPSAGDRSMPKPRRSRARPSWHPAWSPSTRPGHLPGHMSVRVGDELVILGDVAVHPAQLARPRLVYVSDDDADRSARTREEALSAYGDRILACGHFPGSGFGRIVDGMWAAL